MHEQGRVIISQSDVYMTMYILIHEVDGPTYDRCSGTRWSVIRNLAPLQSCDMVRPELISSAHT